MNLSVNNVGNDEPTAGYCHSGLAPWAFGRWTVEQSGVGRLMVRQEVPNPMKGGRGGEQANIGSGDARLRRCLIRLRCAQ